MIPTDSVGCVIHWKTEVDAIADHHQTVKAMVTIALIFWMHTLVSHACLCRLGAQVRVEVLERFRPDPKFICINEVELVLLDSSRNSPCSGNLKSYRISSLRRVYFSQGLLQA
jgi:hypothetical protein